jgi:hypothetical protein
VETGQHSVHLVVDVKKLNRVVFHFVLVCLKSSLIWFLFKVVLTQCRRGTGDGQHGVHLVVGVKELNIVIFYLV